jgi:phospholipid/cholesterol/gamma-HCH transport system ATP-binding protein
MEQNHNPAIRLEAVTKSFDGQRVLDGIDLDIPAGQTTTVLGQSGVGKSVTLKLIIGLEKPDDGEIEIQGTRLSTLSIDELNRLRKRIGFLFQNAALYDSLTVEENVAFPLRRHDRKMKEPEIHDRVRELLARVGMEKAAYKMPADISGGMSKRVGLARALALDPPIMLLDEPTAGLDPITASDVNQLIRELQQEQNRSFVVVTHDMHSVEEVADYIAMIDRGRIVAEGSLDDIKHNENPFVRRFLRESCEVSHV